MEKQIPVIQEKKEQEISVMQEKGEQMINVLPEAYVSGGTITTLPYQEVINILDLDTGIYNIEMPETVTSLPFIGVYYEEEYLTLEWGLGLISVNKTIFAGMEVVSYEFVDLAYGSTNVSGYVVKEGQNISGYYFYLNQNELDKKQNKITSSNQLASDLVDDTNQNNLFVTENEKTTWNNKADIGFYGIIDGTSANPTDGASLLNGVYKVDESKTTSYISLPMEDGTTKKQSVQKGGIVIRTAARLVILATQNLMYQYDVGQHFFYPAEPFVESTLRREFVDGIADLGTIAPPNTYYMPLPISYLSATVNTGDTGHTRLTFTVEERLEKGEFELYLYDTEGNDLLYKDGIIPEPVGGETWIFEIYGNTCEPLRFTDTAVAEVVNYNDVTNKPVVSHKTTSIENRTVTVETTNTTIQGTQAIDTLAGFQFIPLDMSSYTTSAANKALLPETHLPAGVYIVTSPGYMRLGSDTKQLDVGTIIYWRGIEAGGELDLMGYNACEYWGYDSQNDEWSGGYFTTEDDVRYIAGEISNWTIANSTVATGTVQMNDGTWYRRYRPSGVTKLTFNFPNTVDNNYKSRVTCKTASTFSEFVINVETYDIYFYGDDCSNGVLTGVPSKYYDIQARGDGFGGVIVEVHSHSLPTT